jgi:hypothetical protein
LCKLYGSVPLQGLGTLRKFAKAAGIPIEELVAGKRKGKK